MTELFYIVRGNGKYTRSYVQGHKGDYPLFSGNTFGEFARIDSYDYDTLALSWAIDGLAGYIMVHKAPFSATNHRGVLIPKSPNLDLDYVKAVLEPVFRELKKGREGDNGENEYTSLPPFMIRSVSIPMPVDEEGIILLSEQQRIAKQLDSLSSVKEQVEVLRNHLAESRITLVEEDYPMKYFPLSMLFDLVKGSARYTKKYGNLHAGPYPVFSASSSKPLTKLDTFDYDGKYLTWSTNGFAGTILILDGKFSINGDRGILVPKDGRTDLNYDYMKFVLEPLFRELAKGRKGDNGEDEFTKLYPSMISDVMVPVPVDDDGQIDLNAQKEIAIKYFTVQRYQKEIVTRLDSIINQKVSL